MLIIMIKLIFPNETHKKSYEKLIKERWKAENIPTSPAKLFAWKDFEEFLSTTKNDVSNNTNWVNSHLYFFINDEIPDEIIWAIQIRHNINHPNLIEKWWHIWYWIAPKFRWMWLAKTMLKLWIEKAKELWINEILLSCDINNIPSNKTIIANWWKFERLTSDWSSNRYWINF